VRGRAEASHDQVENFPMDDIRVCMDDIRVYACTVASREIHLDYLPPDLVSRCTSGAGSTPGYVA